MSLFGALQKVSQTHQTHQTHQVVNQVVNLVVNQVDNKYLHTYDTSSLSPNPYPIAMAPQRWMILKEETMTQ
jgi:hypothetical protein